MKTVNVSRFISFEGIDFSGKSTQIALLKKYLEEQKHQVYVLREPGATILSEQIRDILLDKSHSNMTPVAEMFLYSAARNQLLNEKILPMLDQGFFIIADRYVDSTTAYQGYGRQLELNMVQQINQAATGGILPGITFYLDVPPSIAMQRLKNSNKTADRLEGQGIDFYTRVFDGYRAICNKNKARVFKLDGTQPVEAVHKRIREIVKTKILGL